MTRDIHEELSEMDKNEEFAPEPESPSSLKPDQVPLAYLNKLMFAFQAETTKNPEKSHHDKKVTQKFTIKDYSVCYSPKLLNIFKSLIWMQIVFNNYNFATYKSFMKELVNVIRDSKSDDMDDEELSEEDLKKSVEDLEKLMNSKDDKEVEDLLKNKDSLFKKKKIDLRVIIYAINSYLESKNQPF